MGFFSKLRKEVKRTTSRFDRQIRRSAGQIRAEASRVETQARRQISRAAADIKQNPLRLIPGAIETEAFLSETGLEESIPETLFPAFPDLNFPDEVSQFLGESFVGDDEEEDEVEFGGATRAIGAPGSRASTIRKPSVNTGLRIGSGAGGLRI